MIVEASASSLKCQERPEAEKLQVLRAQSWRCSGNCLQQLPMRMAGPREHEQGICYMPYKYQQFLNPHQTYKTHATEPSVAKCLGLLCLRQSLKSHSGLKAKTFRTWRYRI